MPGDARWFSLWGACQAAPWGDDAFPSGPQEQGWLLLTFLCQLKGPLPSTPLCHLVFLVELAAVFFVSFNPSPLP